MLIIQHRLVVVMPRASFRYSTQVHGWGLQRQGALLIMLWQIFSQLIRYLCAMVIAGESGPALDNFLPASLSNPCRKILRFSGRDRRRVPFKVAWEVG